MKRLAFLSTVTPALIVCVAAPVLFLIAPDGIPCVYADCGVRYGACSPAAVGFAASCYQIPDSTENIRVQNCSASGSHSYCELYASLDVTIAGSTTCDAVWFKVCGGTPCAGNNTKALDGPVLGGEWKHLSTSLNCNGSNEFMYIGVWGASPGGDCGGACEQCQCANYQGSTEVYEGHGWCGY